MWLSSRYITREQPVKYHDVTKIARGSVNVYGTSMGAVFGSSNFMRGKVIIARCEDSLMCASSYCQAVSLNNLENRSSAALLLLSFDLGFSGVTAASQHIAANESMGECRSWSSRQSKI